MNKNIEFWLYFVNFLSNEGRVTFEWPIDAVEFTGLDTSHPSLADCTNVLFYPKCNKIA